MTFYCPNCWHEIDPKIEVCPHCGSNQEMLSEEEYDEKLLRALHHTEPTTPIRAAYILGERHSQKAVPFLEAVIDEQRDPYLSQACVVAIGKIGLEESLSFLETCLLPEQGVLTRNAAYEAIKHIRQINAVTG